MTDNQGTNLTKLYAAVWDYLEDYAPNDYALEIAVEAAMDDIVSAGSSLETGYVYFTLGRRINELA
jgi:hypothetical protein